MEKDLSSSPMPDPAKIRRAPAIPAFQGYKANGHMTMA